MVHSQRHVNSNSPCLLEAGGVLLLLLLSAPLSQEPLDVFLLTFLSPPHFPLFWPYHMAGRILVPNPGMELMAPPVEAWRPNHWTFKGFPH